MNLKQVQGKSGEEIAVNFLKQEGYKIICRNFRCFQGEIDIIAQDKEEIVFVEVKTRTSVKYGEAKEAVDKEKQKHIYKTAEYFIYKTKIEESHMRIDVIEVYIFNRQSKYKPYKTGSMK